MSAIIEVADAGVVARRWCLAAPPIIFVFWITGDENFACWRIGNLGNDIREAAVDISLLKDGEDVRVSTAM